MTVIALDAMGGDNAPRVPVRAAVRFTGESTASVVLVGDEPRVRAELDALNCDETRLRIHHCAGQVAMDARPASVLRVAHFTSLGAVFELLAAGTADAAVSAGNTGAMMVTGRSVLGMLPGIERPAIATPLPLKRGALVLIDTGANVDCKPRYLPQFARMGEAYARIMLGVANPRVALLSNGSEPGKGPELNRQATPLLQEGCRNFIGNLEPRDLFRGRADVVVCDGFVGNLVLKTAEATTRQTRDLMRGALDDSIPGRLAGWVLGAASRRVTARTDAREVGGSLLMGLRGNAMVCHGDSNTQALASGLRAASRAAQRGLVGALAADFEPGTAAGPVPA